MGRPYSADLRERIVKMVEGGSTRRAAAEHFDVSASSAIKWMQRWQTTGQVGASQMGAPKRSKLDPYAEWLLELVKAVPDITLEDVREQLRQRGLSASIGLVWNFFDRHDISFKKNRARQRTGTR